MRLAVRSQPTDHLSFPCLPLTDKALSPLNCRLRKYTCSAPRGSMERHVRRVAVLRFCKAVMEGRAQGGAREVGGCCSVVPFEAALAMLEVWGMGGSNPQASLPLLLSKSEYLIPHTHKHLPPLLLPYHIGGR